MLLLDEDYTYLKMCGLAHAEDETQRYFVLEQYPLPPGVYTNGTTLLDVADVLVRIPGNYNTAGTDMLWVYPALVRADGQPIPNAHGAGQGDPSHFRGKEFCRWSRHYTAESWKVGVDGVVKIISRIEWALRNPDADKAK